MLFLNRDMALLKSLRRVVMTPVIYKYPCRNVAYVQGQEPEPKIREYFYYIDHEGMVSFLRLECLIT